MEIKAKDLRSSYQATVMLPVAVLGTLVDKGHNQHRSECTPDGRLSAAAVADKCDGPVHSLSSLIRHLLADRLTSIN